MKISQINNYNFGRWQTGSSPYSKRVNDALKKVLAPYSSELNELTKGYDVSITSVGRPFYKTVRALVSVKKIKGADDITVSSAVTKPKGSFYYSPADIIRGIYENISTLHRVSD